MKWNGVKTRFWSKWFDLIPARSVPIPYRLYRTMIRFNSVRFKFWHRFISIPISYKTVFFWIIKFAEDPTLKNVCRDWRHLIVTYLLLSPFVLEQLTNHKIENTPNIWFLFKFMVPLYLYETSRYYFWYRCHHLVVKHEFGRDRLVRKSSFVARFPFQSVCLRKIFWKNLLKTHPRLCPDNRPYSFFNDIMINCGCISW